MIKKNFYIVFDDSHNQYVAIDYDGHQINMNDEILEEWMSEMRNSFHNGCIFEDREKFNIGINLTGNASKSLEYFLKYFNIIINDRLHFERDKKFYETLNQYDFKLVNYDEEGNGTYIMYNYFGDCLNVYPECLEEENLEELVFRKNNFYSYEKLYPLPNTIKNYLKIRNENN